MRRCTKLLTLACLLALSCLAVAEKAAPDFSLPDWQGHKFGLKSVHARVVLLDFWASWCQPCLKEIPSLNAVHQKYKSRGFTVLGISMDQGGWPAVLKAARTYGIGYPVLLGNEKTADAYHASDKGFPCAFLIKDGKILKTLVGERSQASFEKEVQAALQ